MRRSKADSAAPLSHLRDLYYFCFSTSFEFEVLDGTAARPGAFFGIVGANLLLSRILAPNFQKMIGMGTRARATKPSSEPAQLTPRPLNMYWEKSGKTAPQMERRKVLAAMAEAALFSFALVMSMERGARKTGPHTTSDKHPRGN